MSKRKSYRQLDHISTATLLEEASHVRLILKGIVAVLLLVIALLVWASFATIEEITVTYGEIVPKGQVQVVQHLEGGIVSQVLVNDGEKVKKGQLLIKLDSTSTLAELRQLRSREISLVLDLERLKAYVKSRSANLVKWSDSVIQSKYNTVRNKNQIAKLLENEKSLLESQNRKRKDQQSILKAAIAQKQEKLRQISEQLKVWEKHISLLTKEFNMYKQLKKGNLISHKDYLIVLREMNKAYGERVSLSSQILQTEQAIGELRNKLEELTSNLQEQALKERNDVNANLLETHHKIEKLEDRLARMSIKAPISGVVKGLRVFAGNVVQPGGLLLEVVPADHQFEVESRINPRDIGYVKVGDPVKVKILTYDFARYGSIPGKIIKISAATFSDKQGKPYYKATIILDQQYLGSVKHKKVLLPGMTAEANIVTGKKTLMQYLLKPIKKSAGAAFQER